MIKRILNKKNTVKTIIFLCLFLLAFSLFLYPIRIYKFWDEAAYLASADYFSKGDGVYHELFVRAPLLPLIIFLIKNFLPGDFLLNLAYFFTFFSCAAIFPVYGIARKIAGAAAGFFSVFFFITNLMIQHAAHQVMTDLPAAVLLLYSLFFLFLINKNKNYAYLTGVFLGLSFLMRFGAAPGIGVIFILGFFVLKDYRNFIKIILSLGLTLLPYLIWSAVKFQNVFYSFLKAGENIHQAPFVAPSYYFYQLIENIGPVILVLCLFLIVYYVIKNIIGVKNFVARDQKKLKIILVLLAWIVFYFIYLLNIKWKEERFLLPVYSAFFILAGSGLAITVQLLCNLMRSFNTLYRYLYSAIFVVFMIIGYSLLNFSLNKTWMKEYYNYISRINILFFKIPVDVNRKTIDKQTFNNYLVSASKYIKNRLAGNPGLCLYLYEHAPVMVYYIQPKRFFTIQYTMWTNMEYQRYMTNQGIIYIQTNTCFRPTYNFAFKNKDFTLLTNTGSLGIFLYNPMAKISNHK